MLNSPFLGRIYGKLWKETENVEMLSCSKFHHLSPLLEVFFDLRKANRVPKRLNVNMFNIRVMAKFSCLSAYFSGNANLTNNCVAAIDPFIIDICITF